MSKSFHHKFQFLNWHWQDSSLQLYYEIESVGPVTEVLTFPEYDKELFHKRENAIRLACNWLHWLCGVSYYKSGLAETIEFMEDKPDLDFATFLQKTWTHGLGELAYENQVDLNIQIDHSTSKINHPQSLNLRHRALLPFGGGKDSLVSFEQLEELKKDFDLFMVGNAELIKKQAKLLGKQLIQVQRKIDPKLIEFNKRGAFNGHVPITSINSAAAVLTALLLDYDAVIFSNERSADSPNVVLDNGQPVNHQYSKSLEFEREFHQLIESQLCKELKYFSLQRPHSELQILKTFSNYPQHFKIFSSCNRNFHLAGSRNTISLWCGDCPKCRFTYLGLAPFVEKQQLKEIFAKDLLDDTSQEAGFKELLGLQGIKPFECVGETIECQLALQMLAQNPQWQESELVVRLSQKIPEVPANKIQEIFSPSPKHLIPQEYLL